MNTRAYLELPSRIGDFLPYSGKMLKNKPKSFVIKFRLLNPQRNTGKF